MGVTAPLPSAASLLARAVATLRNWAGSMRPLGRRGSHAAMERWSDAGSTPPAPRALPITDPPQSFIEALARIGAAVGAERHAALHRRAPTLRDAARSADGRSPTAARRARGAGDARLHIEPFVSAVPDSVLRDLRHRLQRTQWSDFVPGASWADGTDPVFLRRLVEHWIDGYDWRVEERRINALPQYRATVDGTEIHFVHIRGNGPSTIPLVLTHGWPGSFLEYRKLIPLLTDPARHGGDPRDAFDVVVPSLPGFGFSAHPSAPGMHPERVASLWMKLMTDVLGYERFAAHGSDIGANVTALMALLQPDRLLGIHVTSVTGSALVRWLGDGARPLSDAERRFTAEVEAWTEAEGGYSHLQRTKPLTLAHALADSPAGLAAWIVEKYRGWSDCDGDVERRFTLDELLATITLYWVTGTIGPSMRMYFEGRLHPRRLAKGERVEVPSAAALFPRDIARPPREWGERAYRIARWTEMPRGGHFPAHEEPGLLADDLAAFFREMRPSA